MQRNAYDGRQIDCYSAARIREIRAEDAATPSFEDAAWEEGHAAGVAAGSWVIDGNTSTDTAREILRGLDEGDPAVVDALPSAPLSGEWADAPLPRDVLAEYGLSEDDPAADDVLRAYEDGYSAGVVEEVERSARAIL